MSGKMAELEKGLKNVRLVSFTVDPEFDTPEVLAKYAELCGADPKRWWFLTGPKDEINKVATGVHMGKLGDPTMHSTSFVLVDKQGIVRGYYDANDPERFLELKRSIKTLL